MADLPDWVLKLIRRVMGLERGMYVIILMKEDVPSWTVLKLGKKEG